MLLSTLFNFQRTLFIFEMIYSPEHFPHLLPEQPGLQWQTILPSFFVLQVPPFLQGLGLHVSQFSQRFPEHPGLHEHSHAMGSPEGFAVAFMQVPPFWQGFGLQGSHFSQYFPVHPGLHVQVNSSGPGPFMHLPPF